MPNFFWGEFHFLVKQTEGSRKLGILSENALVFRVKLLEIGGGDCYIRHLLDVTLQAFTTIFCTATNTGHGNSKK